MLSGGKKMIYSEESFAHQETWRVLLELREQGEEHELGRF